MATNEELQSEHEAAVDRLLAERAGRGKDSDWALVRALVHRAVHLTSERKAAEYCAVATLLAEMITHAHDVLHPGDRNAPSHGAGVH
jgi:hypothetical protein